MRARKAVLAQLEYPVTLRLPATYTTDWVERCNGQTWSAELGNTEATVVERRGRDVIVTVNRAGLEDLISDIDYYTDPNIVREIWTDYRGIVLSARSAHRRVLSLGLAE